MGSIVSSHSRPVRESSMQGEAELVRCEEKKQKSGCQRMPCWPVPRLSPRFSLGSAKATAPKA
jgi:hypothetical protein